MSRLIGLTIRHLLPGCFALVMATGIVSIGSFLLGMGLVGWALFFINMVAYASLLLLTLARLILHRDKVFRDLADSGRGPGFLTSVAATCIVGCQVLIFLKSPDAGLVFWLLGLVLWLTVMYALLAATVTKPHKPDIRHALHGGWLILVVATQSVVVLGLSCRVPNLDGSDPLRGVVPVLLGSMLYVIIITLIFQRLVFAAMTPGDLTPPYWIDMGAVAITTLAGSTLVLAAPRWEFLQLILPFLLGLTVLFWATATWWIPLLLILNVWRHWLKRYPLRYDPLYWDVALPLGMYTTCTLQLARAAKLRLEAISEWLIYLALAAWLVVFFGLLGRIARRLFPGRPSHEAGNPHAH